MLVLAGMKDVAGQVRLSHHVHISCEGCGSLILVNPALLALYSSRTILLKPAITCYTCAPGYTVIKSGAPI